MPVKDKKRWIQTTLVMILVAAALVAGALGSMRLVSSMMRDNSIELLTRLTAQGMDNIQQKLENDFRVMESMADVLGLLPDLRGQQALAFLQAHKEEGSLYRMVTTPDGECYTTDGRGASLPENEGLRRALAGERVISEIEPNPLPGGESEVVIVSVPIWRDGQLGGALSCVHTVQSYQRLMTIDAFSGAGFPYVVARDGSLKIVPEDSSIPVGDNLFHWIEQGDAFSGLDGLRNELEAGNSGILDFKGPLGESFLSYQPLGVDDQYLLYVVPQKLVSGHSERVNRAVLFAAGAVAVAMLVLGGYLFQVRVLRQRAMERLALQDPVTGLHNYNFCREFFDSLPDGGRGCALAQLRLDSYQEIADLFGFQAARMTMQRVVGVLAEEAGEQGRAGILRENYGWLLCPGGDDAALTERLSHVVGKLEHIEVSDGKRDYSYNCTFSCGVYRITGEEASFEEVDDLVGIAVLTVQAQRARYLIFNDAMRKELELKKALLADVGRAFQDREFVPYFQPKYEAATGSVCGAEVLARWNHPQYGLLSPGVFIPILEMSGRILDPDLYMLEEACKQIVRWTKSEQMPVPLTVNISKLNIFEVSFIERLLYLTRKYEVPTCLIDLEMQVEAIAEHLEKVTEAAHKFRKQEFILSIDNFGIHSPMLLMSDLPLDIVEIDRDLIGRLSSQKVRAGLEETVSLCRKLGVTTVATGIETEEQDALLRQMGFDQLQGFYYSKPQAMSEFEELIF